MAPDSAMTDLEQGMAFGRYLLGDAPSEDALRLFVRAAATLPPLDQREARLAAFLLRNRWAIGPVDAALALMRPASPVRGRIFLMLAVLECLPEYAPRFPLNAPAPPPDTSGPARSGTSCIFAWPPPSAAFATALCRP